MPPPTAPGNDNVAAPTPAVPSDIEGMPSPAQAPAGTQAQAQAQTAAQFNTDPDALAKAKAVGNIIGMTPEAVQANLQSCTAQARMEQDRQALAQNPAVADWVVAEPDKSKMATGDMKHLAEQQQVCQELAKFGDVF